MSSILITGGTGTIGSQLIPKLLERGHAVHVLSRSKREIPGATVFQWDIEKEWIEEGAFEGVNTIIHLAGYPVSDGRWNSKRRKLMEDSRIKAVIVLKKHIGEKQLDAFITASGISIYGTRTDEQIYTEDDTIRLSDDDYLGNLTVGWEKAPDLFMDQVKRIVYLRTPIVLSKTGGALEKMKKPILQGIGSPLGSGKQWMPWVHIDDLVDAYIMAVENENMESIYNVAAPEHATNKDFTQKVAKVLGKKLWAPKVPAFVLYLLFGEMANIVLKGSRVSGSKIESIGFKYQYTELEDALKDLLL